MTHTILLLITLTATISSFALSHVEMTTEDGKLERKCGKAKVIMLWIAIVAIILHILF